MSDKKKKYDKNTTIAELMDDGYGGLEALQMLDMLRNGDTVDDIVDSSSWINYN